MSLKMTYFLQASALVSPRIFLNIKLPFWDINGSTPTHSSKSGWECPHRWRNSLISPDIHQPINQPNQNMPHRSELSQDRRQNHQEKHQGYPKTGGSCAIYVRKRTTLMSFLVVLPPVLGQFWCLSWWFCLLSWGYLWSIWIPVDISHLKW